LTQRSRRQPYAFIGSIAMKISAFPLAAASVFTAGAFLASAPVPAAVRVCTFSGSPSASLDRDVAREAFKRARVDASMVTDALGANDDDGVSLKELRRALASRCDVIAGFPRSSAANAASPELRFSRGYLRADYVDLSAAASGPIQRQADVVAATYASPAQLIAVQQYSGTRLDLENTPELTVAAVAGGRAQRAIVWYPAVVAYRRTHPAQRFELSATRSPYAQWQLVFAFDAKQGKLHERIDKALASMQADGRLAALTRDWDLPTLAQAGARATGPALGHVYRDGPALRADGAARPARYLPSMSGRFLRVSAGSPGDMPSFDNAQIGHGKTLYASACAKCHGASLQGVTAPALTGPAFAPASNSHLTIGGIFGYMSTNMPADRPGKLKPQDYADIMAFLLYSNGYRPKAAKLTADVARASVTPLNAGPGQ
jgi:polar amino acid transport system substrate-binding protein